MQDRRRRVAVELGLGVDIEGRTAVVRMHLAQEAFVDEREHVVMQASASALEPPVLADRRLGQRAAGADGEERQCAKRLVLVRRGRVEHRLRDDALGEVVAALERLAPGDGEHTTVPQRLEHHLRRLPVPHVGAVARALEVARAERALGADPLQHRLDEVRVCLQRALVEAPVRTSLHRPAAVRPELDGEEAGLVRPVLEDAAGGEQALQLLLGEGADAARQRETVRAVDRRDRVELHRAEPANRVLDVAGPRAAEARRVRLRRHGEPPDRGEADGRGCHLPLPSR